MSENKQEEIEKTETLEISLAEESLYPHLKITSEEFPRLLVTRKIADDDAEYFGAFLPATGVRFWLEFINRTFRLRTCQIPIDGNFPVPCPQFYNRRCLAPCVKALCDRKSYLEMVEIVRLFLRNEREKVANVLAEKIETAAENLDYEKAAGWRDILLETNKVFAEKDWQLWLDDAVDTFEVEERAGRFFVYLVTQRGRKTLGKKVFVFENQTSAADVLSQMIRQFYKFHASREIRIPFDFPDRKSLAGDLGKREKRDVKFTIFGENNQRKTSIQALKRTKFDFDFKQIKPSVKIEVILLEIQKLFGLSHPPQKIEAFDAAHISGTNLTAAKIAWAGDKFLTDENEFWLLDESSEIESLRRAVEERFHLGEIAFPDLLLIDGGKSQLQAAVQAVGFLKNRQFTIVCAVKPPGRHGEISHFITEQGKRIEFSSESEAMRILLRLRDEAHELANRIHRLRRESSHFYKPGEILPSIDEPTRRALMQEFGSLKNLSQAKREEIEKFLDEKTSSVVLGDLETNKNHLDVDAKPLIVPIRFDDPNGDARDLQPLAYARIESRKTKKRQNK